MTPILHWSSRGVTKFLFIKNNLHFAKLLIKSLESFSYSTGVTKDLLQQHLLNIDSYKTGY